MAGVVVGAHGTQHAGGGGRVAQDFVRADDAEALGAQHVHDRGQEPVIAGKRRAADAGQDTATDSVGAKIEQRRPPDRAHDDQIDHVLRPQGRHDLTGRTHAQHPMRPGGDRRFVYKSA